MTRKTIRVLVLLAVFCIQSGASAAWAPDDGDRAQRAAGQAVVKIRKQLPATEPYFEEAYGYAVWPTIGRVAFGFGGAYGKGMVIEQDTAIGKVGYWQFTGGIQGGAKTFSMIIFFKDKKALEYFKSGNVQFMGQAGVDIATVGAHGTPGYNDGVAVFTLTKLGLMGELSYSGVKFRYKPL